MRTAEAAVVVRRGREYLVLLRAAAGGGYWHLVAGGVEAGETAAEAAARELSEEVGLDAPVAPLWSFAYRPTPEEHLARALAPEIAVDVFLATAPAGWEPRLDFEHDEHRWLDASAAVDRLFWPEPSEAVELAAGLEDVVWIGGSTCAGKTSIATSVAARHGREVWHGDVREHALLDAAAGRPAIASWLARSLDEQWVEAAPDALHERSLAFFAELGDLLVADAARARRVVAEGHQLQPDVLAPYLLDPRQAVWLVAADDFREVKHFERPHAWATPNKSSDPERAQANRLERDRRVAAHVRDRCASLGLRCIEVDGTRPLDEIEAEVESWLSPFLPVDPGASRSS